MPKRDEAPIGAPCWVDLLTSDQDGGRVFYGELFGWTVDDPGPDYGGYINFQKDGIPVAGCMTNDGSGGPDGWGVYLATDDAEKTVAAATENGGEVIVPAMDIMDLGRMAIVTDVGHAAIGAWQPGRHRGFGLLAEPGAPSWFELHTRDYDASVRFYQDVFKWETSVAGDEPDFRYTTLGSGDDTLAGIMDAERVPARRCARDVVDLLRCGRHRCRARQDRRARRHDRPPRRRQPVRAPGAGRRPDRSAVQARRRLTSRARSPVTGRNSAVLVVE